MKVFSGDLDKALTILQRKMQTSGMERMIKSAVDSSHQELGEVRFLLRRILNVGSNPVTFLVNSSLSSSRKSGTHT